jgi:hypothetical protein
MAEQARLARCRVDVVQADATAMPDPVGGRQEHVFDD